MERESLTGQREGGGCSGLPVVIPVAVGEEERFSGVSRAVCGGGQSCGACEPREGRQLCV